MLDDDDDESKRRFGLGCDERLLRLQDGDEGVPTAAAAAVAPVAVQLVELVIVCAVGVVSAVEPISKLDLGALNISHNIHGKDDGDCLHLPETAAGVVTVVGHYYYSLHNHQRYTRHRVQARGRQVEPTFVLPVKEKCGYETYKYSGWGYKSESLKVRLLSQEEEYDADR